MKKLYQYTMFLMAGVLAACSSMDVSDPYEDNLPAGFDASVYEKLHPELRYLQLKDYVAYYNTNLSNSVTKNGGDFSAMKAADEANFTAATNEANLAAMCSSKFIGGASGHSAESCVNVSADVSLMEELKAFNLVGVTDDFAALESVPHDYVAFSLQYIMFGQSHGWAYRDCSDAELANPGRDSLYIKNQQNKATADQPFQPDPNFYCADQTGALHLVNP